MGTEIGAGAVLTPWTLPDQHDRPHPVDGGTRLVIFSRDRLVTNTIVDVLQHKGAAYLAERHACFVLDVSRMPKLVTSLVAKPRLRRHPFPILLDDEPGVSAQFPARDGHATLLFLDALKVREVRFVASADELLRCLDAQAP